MVIENQERVKQIIGELAVLEEEHPTEDHIGRLIILLNELVEICESVSADLDVQQDCNRIKIKINFLGEDISPELRRYLYRNVINQLYLGATNLYRKLKGSV